MGLNHLHRRAIAHRDLKPENILLESDDLDNISVKLTDFGFSTKFDPDLGLDFVCGSLLYEAPELINHQAYNEKVDIWSLGVMTYMLLTGKIPYQSKDQNALRKMITNLDANKLVK